MKHVIVMFDPTEKHIVRGVFLAPPNMVLEDAENIVKNATNPSREPYGEYVDYLETLGFEGVSWSAVDVAH